MTEKTANYWHSLEDGRIQCDLCPHNCKLKTGEQGICKARFHEDNRLVAATYGHASGFAIDPIEKKPLYHFFPGRAVLSFGTLGCNLNCQFCQNWHLSHSLPGLIKMQNASPASIVNRMLAEKIPGIAFTYNEPVIFTEFAVDVASLCHEHHLFTVAVTAGYIQGQARKDFFSVMDAANVDLKSFQNKLYSKLCGARLKPVLDTLVYIREHTTTWLEITTLIIPGHNDSRSEIQQIARWITANLGPNTPWHLSAFRSAGKMSHVAATNPRILAELHDEAKDQGLHYVYTGNIFFPDGSATRCPACDTKILDRSRFEIIQNSLSTDGTCPHCGFVISGQW